MKRECFALNENCELFGGWWLPSKPNIKIPGILKYNAMQGIELSMEGCFDEMEFELIYGFASGHPITLLRSFSVTDNSFKDFSEYTPCKIISNLALIGANYTEQQFKKVKNFRVDFGGIRNWSEISGFNAKFEASKYTLVYEKPEPIVFLDNNDVTIKLVSSVDGISDPLPESALITECYFFDINFKGDAEGFNYLDYSDGIRKFLTLASRTDVDYKSIYFSGEEGDGHVLFAYPKIKIQYPSRSLGGIYSFFTLPSVASRISSLFQNWLNFYEKSPESANLYFYGYECMTYLKFLAIAQSLEEFHRDILDKANISYARRIKDVFNRYPIVTGKFKSDPEAFSKDVLDHRDYFSHWFDKKKGLVFEGLRFDIFRRDINLLLEMCFLEQCGFSVDEVQKMVEKCLHYKMYIDQR